MPSHLYTAPLQPATEIVVDAGDALDPPLIIRNKPRALVRCWRCNRRRWAARCTAQVFYDSVRFWCRDVKKCKRVRR